MEKKNTVNLNLKQYGMVLALLAIYIIFYILTGGSNATPMNMNNLLMQNGYIVILATGMLLCVLTGNIDLGVGSYVALCGAVAAKLVCEKICQFIKFIIQLFKCTVFIIFYCFNQLTGFFLHIDQSFSFLIILFI